jgi:hypothetical protein
MVNTKGHSLYVVRLASKTIVFDLEEKTWHQWTTNSAGNHINFEGVYSSDYGDGRSLIQSNTNGALLVLDPDVFNDYGLSILEEIYTSKHDFESINRKFMHTLDMIADYSAGETVQIRWSDDDGVTWTSFITCTFEADGSLGFNRLGSFRRRIFNIKYTGSAAPRFEYIECDVSLGDH